MRRSVMSENKSDVGRRIRSSVLLADDMTTQTYTDQQLSDWKRYEKVRKGGKWNMFSPQARAATGLSSERYSFVMEHFSELKDAVEAKSANVRVSDGAKKTFKPE